jgi:hypothetical protein
MVYTGKTLLQNITSGVPDHLYESKHATACEIWLKIPFQQGQHFWLAFNVQRSRS